jgi:type I restriction enzyme S subunit
MNYTSAMRTKTSGHSLPKGWQWVKFGDIIAESQPGFASGQRDSNGVIQLRMNNVDTRGNLVWDEFLRVPANKEAIEKFSLKIGDVVFNNTNSTELVGKSALFTGHEEPITYSNHFTRLRTKPDVADPGFITFWLISQWQAKTFENICNRWIGQSAVKTDKLFALEIPLPPLDEQRRIASRLNEQLAAVKSARKAAEEQLELSNTLINAYLKESLSGSLRNVQLKDGFVEVKKGIGKTWAEYPLLGTTRYGVAPAKEKVGKQPERYKLVEPGTIFYNPMRINIGSIGMLDEGDVPGITSPDYVVINSVKGVIHPRWFYYWFRSPYGEEFIKTYARGAVRERMMFTRLAPAYLEVPSYEVQAEIAEKLLGIKQLQSAIESQLAEINRLPASRLREAFAGQG